MIVLLRHLLRGTKRGINMDETTAPEYLMHFKTYHEMNEFNKEYDYRVSVKFINETIAGKSISNQLWDSRDISKLLHEGAFLKYLYIDEHLHHVIKIIIDHKRKALQITAEIYSDKIPAELS